MSIILQTHELSIGYGSHVVQSGLNLELKAGEMVCMLGKNGCGKSTLLRTISGLQPMLSGSCELWHEGEPTDIHTLSTRSLATSLALVLTERESLDKTYVRDIVSMGRYPYTNFTGSLSAEDSAIVDSALADVWLQSKADSYFNCLSDGEKQRVLIAKALTQQTPLVLLDEPTAHLDLPNRIKTMLLLRQLAHRQQKAILISTHELDLALQTADLIWLMTPGQGVEVGTPEQLTTSGSFERAFADEAFRFNNHNGHLTIDVCQ